MAAISPTSTCWCRRRPISASMPKRYAGASPPTRTSRASRRMLRKPPRKASRAYPPTSLLRNTPSPARRIRTCSRAPSARSRPRSTRRRRSNFPSFTEAVDHASRRLVRGGEAEQRRVNEPHHRIVPPQRDQHVTDCKAPSPDRIDHGVVGTCRGVRTRNGGIGAEMAGEVERELHARRISCEAFVDAELEEEGAVLMA